MANQMNLYTATIPVMKKSLQQLLQLIEIAMKHATTKANERISAEKRMEDLLQDRLVFDQFPLIRQIQIATDNAKGGAGRLAEVEVPKYEDNEKTYEEIKARIEKTIAFLDTFKPEQFEGKEEVKVTVPYWHGKYLTGFEYATQQLMPNFFFHYTTAYAILRKNGVEVGKSDFIGKLPLKNMYFIKGLASTGPFLK